GDGVGPAAATRGRGAGRRNGLNRPTWVQPSQGALLGVEADVGLGDDGLEPVVGVRLLAEDADEARAIVAGPLDVDDERTLEGCLGEDLVRRPPFPLPSTGARGVSSGPAHC